MKNELITFKDGTLELNVPVSWEQETVWITRNQMAELFDRDVKTIGKHINNLCKNVPWEEPAVLLLMHFPCHKDTVCKVIPIAAKGII